MDHVAIEKLEWRTFLERRRAGRFHAVMARLNLSPSPDQFELYHSSSRGRGMNFMGFADAETDGELRLMGIEPAFDGVRSDPRFAAILKKVGLGA